MPSVTFLLALDVPEVSPEALLMESDDVTEACEAKGITVLSCVPWARPTQPLASPAGGFSSLAAPTPPSAPIA